MENKRGITLIALIITIIVLLVLVAVSFNSLFGENGIIQQSVNSKMKTEDSSAVEMVQMAWQARMVKFIEEKRTKVSKDTEYLNTLKDDLNKNLGTSGTIKNITLSGNSYSLLYQDNSGNNFVIEINSEDEVELVESHIDESSVTVKSTLYGQKVSTGVTQINGTNLADNWKIFYIDSSNVYLIYGDYYPNAALQNIDSESQVGISRKDDYIVYLNSTDSYENKRSALKSYINNTTNWSKITEALSTSGTFRGKTLETVGGPTLDLWMNSWNEKYNDTLGYRAVNETDNFGGPSEDGTSLYSKDSYVLTADNRQSPMVCSWFLLLNEKEGYKTGNGATGSGYTDNLYFPHKGQIKAQNPETEYYSNTYGYWLGTYSASSTNGVFGISCTGFIDWNYYHGEEYGVRPVVKISKKDFQEATGIKL